jgi:hypothetical protein
LFGPNRDFTGTATAEREMISSHAAGKKSELVSISATRSLAVNLEEVVHPRRSFGHISEAERPGIAEGQERMRRPLRGLGFEQLAGANDEGHVRLVATLHGSQAAERSHHRSIEECGHGNP